MVLKQKKGEGNDGRGHCACRQLHFSHQRNEVRNFNLIVKSGRKEEGAGSSKHFAGIITLSGMLF